jgi:hypothetical protein
MRGQHFHIELIATRCSNAVDQLCERSKVDHNGLFFGSTKATIEVPKINALRQFAAAFAFDIFTNLVFDGVQNAVAVLTFDIQFECFFHAAIMRCPLRGPRYPAHSFLMHTTHTTPSKEEIALLEPFERLGLNRIVLVSTADQASQACAELVHAKVLGFDTESKPTFVKDQVSEGPHIVQLATADKAWVFQLHDLQCSILVAELMASSRITKAGFGLGDDRKRIIAKLGVEPGGVLELNTIFRELGYRKDMGVKGAVAVLFNKRFLKSKKAATSNWANPKLTEAQLVYAANDAYAAFRVFEALQLF